MVASPFMAGQAKVTRHHECAKRNTIFRVIIIFFFFFIMVALDAVPPGLRRPRG